MARKLIAVLIFALAVPAAALACSQEAQAQRAPDSDQTLIAQSNANITKVAAKKKKKKHKSPPPVM